ncbi:hypothetical protein A9K55_001815 [Cordyceps militaris]|uniref:Uncharacterized protein n=1 Tax=Cordyceps militaris TaxID=73501 RepID=A0A2H4SSL9_CORMI|nr:hypothetical protein A9K55_001815 [Cordyceps militaris]
MARYFQDSTPRIRELRGHGSWTRWHKAVLVQLDIMGLRYLLSANLRPLNSTEKYQYAADQRRAVQLLMSTTSEHVLQKLWNCGWDIPGATLQNTLALLGDLLAEPERHPQQTYETHRDIVDLTRINLAPGSNGLDQFVRDAQQCHLRLLARYGNGNGSVEELLEHLFTSSVMEGLKASQAMEYTEWIKELDKGRRFPFINQLVSLIKGPRLDDMGRHDPALAGAPRGPRARRRATRMEKRNRAAWRLRPYVPYHKRYRGSEYPDCYVPRYNDDAPQLNKHDHPGMMDEIL